MRTLLIDGDILAYKVAARGEHRVDWDGDGDFVQIPLDFSEIMLACNEEVRSIRERLNSEAIIICLSCPTSQGWRREVLPGYKMNRAGNAKPVHLQAAKDYLATAFPSLLWDRLEADDVMGIISTDPGGWGQRIIVSEDKDMKTIPGWLFNPAKDTAPKLISPDEANEFHMMQTLMGDATDGYSGAPGIGPAKAAKVLAGITKPEARWAAVVDCYWKAMEKKQGSPIPLHEAEAAALVQARVARILHHGEYIHGASTVKLWRS